MTEHEREQSKLARLSGYRINGTWNLFEKFVIDGKAPEEALRLATGAMDVWAPWFEENHIEAPDQPDMPAQVEQAAAKVTDAIKKVIADKEASRRQRWPFRWFHGRDSVASIAGSIQHQPIQASEPSTEPGSHTEKDSL